MSALGGPRGSALLKKFQDRYKDVTFPSDAAETLEEVQRFLQANSVQNANDATHEVLADCWWSDSKSGGAKFLGISEDFKLEKLHRYIGKMFHLGAPLALGEKRSNQFQLIQEIQIPGTPQSSLDPELLIAPQSKFLEVIGRAMVELYPLDALQCYVLDGSGTSHIRGCQETLIRLVWHDIIVDKNRAQTIQDVILAKLRSTDCEEVRQLQSRATEISKAENWKAWFKEDIYYKHDPIRMIYNDNSPGSILPRLEGRPLKPMYIYEFKQKEGKLGIESFTASSLNLPCENWAKWTSIRRSGGAELTKWTPPKGYVPKDPNQPQKPRPSVRGGISPGDQRTDRRKADKQAPSFANLERLFPTGTLQDFVQAMKRALGENLGEFSVDEREKKVLWKHDSSGATVEYREANRIVKFSGEASSVRNVLNNASTFLQALPAGYNGKEVSSCAFTNGYSDYKRSQRDPSKVFEPSQGPTSVAALPVASNVNSTRSQPKKVPYKRLVVHDYEKSDAEEVSLRKGDIVTVTEDPEAERTDDMERFVTGTVDATGESGLFVLAFTRNLD